MVPQCWTATFHSSSGAKASQRWNKDKWLNKIPKYTMGVHNHRIHPRSNPQVPHLSGMLKAEVAELGAGFRYPYMGMKVISPAEIWKIHLRFPPWTKSTWNVSGYPWPGSESICNQIPWQRPGHRLNPDASRGEEGGVGLGRGGGIVCVQLKTDAIVIWIF